MNSLFEILYNDKQRVIVDLGRGNFPRFGNIDNLDPQLYSAEQMRCISRGRGNDPYYGNIDDLDPHLYDGDQAAEQGAQPNVDPARPAGDATAAAADAPSTGDEDDDGFLMQGLPFGPFLALAAIEYILVGRLFVGWLTAGLYP